MAKTSAKCHSCSRGTVDQLLDLGLQPLGNRFLASMNEAEELFPLVVGQCPACGLVQISQPAPVDAIRPRFDWITYNEPDAHLDQLVEDVSRIPGISRDSHVGMVVVGGDKTREYFEHRGFINLWRIDLQRDLDVREPHSGTETVQERLTVESAKRIAYREGLFDLLVVRHMVEHAQNVRTFLAAIRALLKPGGYAVFEVPDCQAAFETCDYSILWEEHVFYFMPTTFRHCLETAGFAVLDMQTPVPSLVAVTRKQEVYDAPMAEKSLAAETCRMRHFSQSLPHVRRVTQETLKSLGVPVAFFGAGHMACTYTCVLELGGILDCVVDDHPQKRGMFMPGTRLPVVGSDALVSRGVAACISALSPESEARVAARNAPFAYAGGRFFSVFAGRPNSLVIESIEPCA